MSYCTPGRDSSVYLYSEKKKIECFGCLLQPMKYHWFRDWIWLFYYLSETIKCLLSVLSFGLLHNIKIFPMKIVIKIGSVKTYDKKFPNFAFRKNALSHLLEHVKRGHRVPLYAIERLVTEINKHGDRVGKYTTGLKKNR